MPWGTPMSRRAEFVALAQAPGASIRALCRRFAISSRTAYKWLARAAADPAEPFHDRSRRPHTAPTQTDPAIEARVLAERDAHPAWGGRKLRAVLLAEGVAAPSASTITAILRRHGRLVAARRPQHAIQRFEHAGPNVLWQMDFKGHFALATGRCHPLTVLDDHSRYNLVLAACGDEQATTVQRHLQAAFRLYGLPERMLMDHGSPWGDAGDQPYTAFTVWLLRLGIRVSHGRPGHPQTQGKDERFHRTLMVELLRDRHFADLAACQRAFDAWRVTYNQRRPHQALADRPPASRYQVSLTPYPEVLPPIEYGPDDQVRMVQQTGLVHFAGRRLRLGKAFTGQPVAFRPTAVDGEYAVYYCHHRLRTVNLGDLDRLP